MGRSVSVSVLLLLWCAATHGAIYVSPAGNDANTGTESSPFATLPRAMSAAKPGDTIYVRGGVYTVNRTITTPISGTPDSTLKLWAYPGESPLLDFSTQPRATASRGIALNRNYWHIRGLQIRRAGDNGMHVSGGYNLVENSTFFQNDDSGLQISNGGHHNRILNCDSYGNYDSVGHGEDADGFAPKLDVGPGNEFVGCRAWENSDDGWDLYQGAYSVMIDRCWAFRNGINIWGDTAFQGDGNGFKVGGNYIPAWHRVSRSVAFDNAGKGFDQNHNTAGVAVISCTGWRNGRNFVFPEVPASGRDTLANNISYQGTIQIEGASLQSANSWQLFTVSTGDFISLDTSLARAAREPSGDLPENGFLRLAQGSLLIDAGMDFGLPYRGAAPDLGAFESDYPTAVTEADEPSGFPLLANCPNPFNPSTVITYELPEAAAVRITVYDLLGREVATLVNERQSGGRYTVEFHAAGLASGPYLCRLIAGEHLMVRKLVLAR